MYVHFASIATLLLLFATLLTADTKSPRGFEFEIVEYERVNQRKLHDGSPDAICAILGRRMNNKMELLPKPSTVSHTPVYDKKSVATGETFGSVNAGSVGQFRIITNLGVNAAFNEAIKSILPLESDISDISKDMESTYKQSVSESNRFTCLKTLTSKVKAMCGSSMHGHSRVGTTIITEFKSGIYGVPENLFMVYTVGPFSENKGEFVQQLDETMQRMLRTVVEWNKLPSLTKIKRLRVSLVSGGTFKHRDVPVEEVATTSFSGIAAVLEELEDLTGVPFLEFSYAGGAFHAAWEMLSSTSPSLKKLDREESSGDESTNP